MAGPVKTDRKRRTYKPNGYNQCHGKSKSSKQNKNHNKTNVQNKMNQLQKIENVAVTQS